MVFSFFICIQSAEKLHAQTLWGDRRDWNKDLLSSNCMLYMCPCSSTDNPSGPDLGWKLSKAIGVFWKKVVFFTNLEQMLQPTATSWQWHSWSWHVRSKVQGCCLMVATASMNGQSLPFQDRLSMCKSMLPCSLIGRRPLVWGPVTWEAKPRACPIQSSDINGRDMLIQKRFLLPISLRQQQPHQAYLSAHISLCCVVGFV